MVLFNGNVLRKFDIVYGLQDSKSLTDGCNSHLLEAFGVEHAEDITGNVVLWEGVRKGWSIRRMGAHTFDRLLVLRKTKFGEPVVNIVLVPV